MAKKKSSKKRTKSTDSALLKKVLPQNIVPVGDRVEENKNIYILQSVYKEIHKFTKNKTTNESGGVLIGTTLEEFGKTNIIISGFVEAKYVEATPTTLTFTHDTWEYIHKEVEKRFPRGKILGWIHTHPDFGIFLSDYDKFIHENFFSEDHQIAYVIDPIQKIEGFYFWINGNLEKCKGFYVYDKTGAKIDIETTKDSSADMEYKDEVSAFSFKNVLLAVLSVIVALLLVVTFSQNSTIKQIEKQQLTFEEQTKLEISLLAQQLFDVQSQLATITATDSTEPTEPAQDDGSGY